MADSPAEGQRKSLPTTAEEMWRMVLTEGDPSATRQRRFLVHLPSNPRCAACYAPFAGVGSVITRLIGRGGRSSKNPRYCSMCERFLAKHPGGAEIELTMLFVDVRGSTMLAEKMSATEFSRLMNRFYEAAIGVLVRSDALVDKLIGDEVTALFIPGYAGKQHARRAVEAGQELLHATGHGTREGPWAPIGIGIHTGEAYVGYIASASETADFTALGDNVNITARLVARAGAGEILVSEAACRAAALDCDGLERRDLELKGKSVPVAVRVLHAA